MPPKTAPHYVTYIRPHELNRLQGGLDTRGDAAGPSELEFIIAHQKMELSFKAACAELEDAVHELYRGTVSETNSAMVTSNLQRAKREVLAAVAQFVPLRTITPQSFNTIRTKLGDASGYQSLGFRYLDALLGVDFAARKAHREGRNPLAELDNPFPAGSPESEYVGTMLKKLERAAAGFSLSQALNRVVASTPIAGRAVSEAGDDLGDHLDRLQRCFEEVDPARAEEAMQFFKALDVEPGKAREISIRRRIGTLRVLLGDDTHTTARGWLQSALALEDAVSLWKFHHLLLARAVMGDRSGTFGTSGIRYLATDLLLSCFEEARAVISFIVEPEILARSVGPS